MEAIWNEVKAVIKDRIPTHSYRMWIEPLEYFKGDDCNLVVTCPNIFSKKRVQENYSSTIETELNKHIGKKCKLGIEISDKKITDSSFLSKENECQLYLPNINIVQSSGRILRKNFTFDKFVVSGNNRFAYSAAFSVANHQKLSQNCLFLLSGTGMGKSHLSQAIGHHIIANHPGDRVYYITAEDFTNEMVNAFRTDSIDKFKERYRNQCDVLILEDVHFLTGKDRTQVELVLALDYLLDNDKKIIFTSCYLPSEIPKMNDQLRSRLCSGVIPKIEPPDFRTRLKILQKKVTENGYTIPADILEYLASELIENIRQLESGLIGVAAKSSLLEMPVDINLAQSVVKNIVTQRKEITIDLIKDIVCKHFNINLTDIMSNSRKQSVVRPRQIAIYLSRKYTDQSLQAIGKSFNRYHATAIRSISAVEKGIKEDNSVKKQVQILSEKLETGSY